MKKTFLSVLIGLSLSVVALQAQQAIDRTCATCSRLALDSANLDINPVRVNQVGYMTADPHKRAYVADPSSMTFKIIKLSDQSTAYSGTLKELGNYPELDGKFFIKRFYSSIIPYDSIAYNGDGKEHLYCAEFGDFSAEGSYKMVVGSDTSSRFDIRETIYNDVFETSLKFFGVNRCGDTKSWFHDACHVKDGSALGSEYVGALSGGWHDCGDHGKYSETVAYSALMLNLAYVCFPQKAEDRYGESYNDTIPFGNDGIPDLLWEGKVGADYIYKLYTESKKKGLIEQADMYHSVGSGPGMDHLYWDIPEHQDVAPLTKGGPDRPVTSGIGANVSGMFASILALFSWAYEPFDPEYAAKCRDAAIDIYDNVVLKKLGKKTSNPCCYDGGGQLWDDPAMAAVSLWFATGQQRFGYDLLENPAYGTAVNAVFNQGVFPKGMLGREPFHHGGWTTDFQQVNQLCLYALAKLILVDAATAAKYGITATVRDSLWQDATVALGQGITIGSNGKDTKTYYEKDVKNNVDKNIRVDPPYNGVFTSVDWGYNRYNMGMVAEIFLYWDLMKEEKYYNVGLDNLNYNLGMNPWDLSFIMGTGSKNLQHPHNRAANPEGYNAGGIPYEYKSPKGALMGGSRPGKVLIDQWDQYTVTETCIDFSSQVIFPALILSKDLPPDKEGPQFYNIIVQQVGRTNAIITWKTNELSRDTLYYSLTPGGPIVGKMGSPLSMQKGSTLTGLSPNTTYYFYLEGMDIYRNVARDNNKGLWYSFTTTDKDPPAAEISDVRVCNVTHNTATVYWWTKNGPYTSKVEYSSDSAHFVDTKVSKDVDDEGIPVRFHKVTLKNLKPDTKYFFDVISGATVSDNGGKHYSFSTTQVLVDYKIRIKPISKGKGTAMFVLEAANEEALPYAGLELRFYFNADATTAQNLKVVSYSQQIFDVGGSVSQPKSLVIGAAKPVDGFTNSWYIPIAIGDTLPVAGRIRFELQFNSSSWEKPEVPFSLFKDAWSIIPQNEPVKFGGVDLNKLYDEAEPYVVNGVLTYSETEYITAHYKGKHVYGYPPNWQDNIPETHKTVELILTEPAPTPVSFVEQDSFKVNFAGRSWAYPNGNISDVEINADPITFTKISNRADSVLFTHKINDLAYGSNSYTVVAWHDKKEPDCACQYRNMNVEVDTVKAPLIERFITVEPSDPIEIYQNKRVLLRISLKDSAGAVVTDGDIRIGLTSSSTTLRFFKSAESSDVLSTVDLVNGYAEVYVSGSLVLDDGELTFDAANPRPLYSYTSASVKITILMRPLWPVISSAKAIDDDADIIPDHIKVVLSEPYKTGQELKSAVATYKNKVYDIGLSDITKLDSITFLLALPSGLAVDPIPYGTIQLKMDVDGEDKSEKGIFSDGVGPAIKSAVMSDNMGIALDSLTITLTEGIVNKEAFAGGTLELIRAATGDTVVLTVVTVEPTELDEKIIVTTMASGTVRPLEGDLLRLVPGIKGSPLSDRSDNKPHALNKPVTLKSGPAQLAKGWYFDSNADGVVDKIRLKFSKRVFIDDLIMSLEWNVLNTVNDLQESNFEYLSDDTGKSDIIVNLPDSFKDKVKLETSGTMTVFVNFKTFPEVSRRGPVADSAAPVIVKAVITPGVIYDESRDILDTLRVTFSEKIKHVSPSDHFLLKRDSSTSYTFDTELYAIQDNMGIFLIKRVLGVDYPVSGDSIWINSSSAIGDTLPVWQTNPDNRRVALSIIPVKIKWEIAIGPNPFIAGKECVIAIKPMGKTRGELDIDAMITIYDQVGNKVIRDAKLERTGSFSFPAYSWNGYNSKGRIVGPGTYLGLIKINAENGNSTIRVPIGVKRK